jgi:dihydrofolate reductase
MVKGYFDIIMAASKSGGVGLNGGLPWNVPKEFNYFI